jgi:predicted phage terminase large subunit-like protein
MSSRDKIRRLADASFYFFAKEILGYSKMSEVPHLELCAHVESKGKRKKLTLMPRGSFKSSVVTVGGTIRRLTQNPNLRVLIVSETQKNAIKYVKEIRTHLEQNQKFRAIYGDWVGDSTWRDFEFFIKPRTQVKKEPTVMAGSLEKGVLTGMHFDIIILDDVVSLNNINTPDQIEKTLSYYRMLNSILDPGGEVWVNGTRYSVFDLYGWILDPLNGERDNFEILLKRAEDEDGTLLMPNVLTKEFLTEQRKTQGEYIYNCQYNNSPISSETSTFKKENVIFYDEAPKHCINFLSLDCAVSEHVRSDFSALLCVGVDHENNWYVKEARNIKKDPAGVIAELFEVAMKYKPIMCMGMEKFMLEKALKPHIMDMMERLDFYFPIKELGTNSRISKETRIRGLQPMFEQGKIRIKREHTELAHQIVYHPQVKHDDLLDSLKNFLQIVFPADIPPETKIIELSHLSQNELKVWQGGDKKLRRSVRKTKSIWDKELMRREKHGL